MPADKHIEKFIRTLQPLFSVPLFDRCYTNIKDLLDKARNIEDMKKDIVVNFLKQEKFGTLKSNQGAKKLTKRSAGFAKLTKLAVESTDAKRGFARAN